MKTTKNNEGSMAITIVVLIIVSLLVFIGWELYSRSAPQTGSTSNTNSDMQSISTADGKLSFFLPKDWRVTTVVANPKEGCGFMGSGSEKTGSCALDVTLAPQSFNDPNNIWWHVRVYQTDTSPKLWAEAPLGLPGADFQNQSTEPINGYDAYYVKIVNNSYTDLNYFVAHDGYLAYFYARESDKHYNAQGQLDAQNDRSVYTKGFMDIVHSIQIK